MRAWTLLCCTLLFAACSGDNLGAAMGEEGGPCFADGSCDPGLLCVFETCVASEACVEGELQACECADGGAGVATCWSDELWGPCVCLPDCGDGACDVGEHPETCPQDCGSDSCGNGVVEAGEHCDATNLAGHDCVSLGYVQGTLSCAGDCTLDLSGCSRCGDGVVDPGEACDDGNQVSGDGCAADCLAEEVCGNGVLDLGEMCDATELSGFDCVGLGYTGGTLGCTTSCVFDVSGCQMSDCGNGVAELGEACDGPDLDGETCVSLGHTAGTLACQFCQFDESACTTCGNGVHESGEACDDGNTTDDLTCSADCTAYCGDNVVNITGVEACDGPDLDGADCTTLGFLAGWLACDASCAYDTTNCSSDCTDGDGDGYGVGADCLGWDCNDSDPACHVGACCPAGTGIVGEPCADVSQCPGITNGTPQCMTTIGGMVQLPGGYCTGDGCTVGQACDIGSGVCVDLFGFVQLCLKVCTAPSECRQSEGYDCVQLPSAQPGDPTYCLPPMGP